MMLVAVLLIAMSVGKAGAANITPGSFSTTLSSLQAGAHPDLTTAFRLDTDAELAPVGGSPRDLDVVLPAGLVGAANATPTCLMGVAGSTPDLFDHTKGCPPDSAVGEADVLVSLPGAGALGVTTLIYNVAPAADEPAAFGFNALFPVRLSAKVRSDGDYGLTASLRNITEGGALVRATVKLWGVPADHNGPGPEYSRWQNLFYGGRGNGQRRAFLTNPTACPGTSLTSSLLVDSWLAPGVFTDASFDVGQVTGCDLLVFDPTVDVRPDSLTAGAPAGLSVDIEVPQNPDPDGLATPNVKDVTVALPAGTTLSPSAADGLGGCSDEQIALHSLGAAACPDSSKIGTVQISTPLLDQPLVGEVFLGTQESQDPRSGEMYRVFLQVAGSGVRVKLAGSVVADPVTGRLTATFAGNPQLPFSRFLLSFKGGARAPLLNPSTCGVKRAGLARRC
jgi:hypothetical protein